MLVRYAVHPMEFAIGDTEQFYEKMAADGWILEKRGAVFSRFRRGEPQRLRYRIELAESRMLDPEPIARLPEEQIAVYEDCGWQFVTRHGLIYVFSAPADGDAPEFYTTPEQQAAVFKPILRQIALSFLVTAAFFALYTAIFLSSRSYAAGGFWWDLYYTFLTAPGLTLLCLGWLAWALFYTIYSAVQYLLLYRRLRRGIPMDHAPGHRFLLYKTARALLWTLMLAGALQGAVQGLTREKGELPTAAEGPYLLLDALGIEGERGSTMSGLPYNVFELQQTPLLTFWDTSESVLVAPQEDIWLDQQVYELADERLAPGLVTALCYRSIFNDGPSDFAHLSDDRFDQVLAGRDTLIVARGSQVWCFTHLFEYNPPTVQDLLDGVAALPAE